MHNVFDLQKTKFFLIMNWATIFGLFLYYYIIKT